MTSSSKGGGIAGQLPLRLIQSEIIPPAATASPSAVDFLADFCGYSWIAYGASNLVVISHFPSPLSHSQTLIGPISRQVLHLGRCSDVSAVSWSPASASGDLAAAVDNCIGLFSPQSSPSGSFSWRQTAVLVQSTKVETITWTGSGDGIICGGFEVVLWRRIIKSATSSWEIAWKFKQQLSQNLVAATFSIQGPLATAHMSQLNNNNNNNNNDEPVVSNISENSQKHVLLCYGDSDLNYVKSKLHHPMPVCMIQWRPITGKKSKQGAIQSMRQVLLTCCLDGTVRLWCEINDGKVNRIVKKDIMQDGKTTRRYHVAAIIEINQTLGGTLGSDVYVKWATEVDGVITTGKASDSYSHPLSYNLQQKTRSCEWLIAVGPRKLVTFWAVHYLDDVSPLRFPRVSLWGRRELTGSKLGTNGLLLDKILISRNHLFHPPNICSLVQLMPSNSLVWSQLYTTPPSANKEEVPVNEAEKENSLSSYAGGVLNLEGHVGKVLQVAVHQYRSDIDLAASLDTDGALFLWVFPTSSHSLVGMPTINSTHKLSAKLSLSISHPRYTSMVWAPSVLDNDVLLLMGHDQGIDFILIKIFQNLEDNISCHKLCTIPFSGEDPISLYSIPLLSDCKKSFRFNSFLLLAMGNKRFQALSWKITIHSSELDVSTYESNFDCSKTVGMSSWAFESDFAGKRYCIAIDSCSSLIPDPHNKDEVTSFCAVTANISSLNEELKWDLSDELPSCYSYHLITGYNNGNLKLWRSTLDSTLQWELVGMLATDQGSITSISVSDFGRRISTLSHSGSASTSSTIHIWKSIHVHGSGSFVLEDTLSFDKEVVALSWYTLGNGQLILGVCLQNEFHVYAEIRSDLQPMARETESLGGDVWFCISSAQIYSAIRNFVWGPRGMAIALFDGYFSISSQWTFLIEDENQAKSELARKEETILSYNIRSCHEAQSEMLIAQDDSYSESFIDSSNKREWCSKLPMTMNTINVFLSSILTATSLQKYDSNTKIAIYSLQDVVDKLSGSLPVYHPKALLTNIYTGQWKRAYVALSHLLDYSRSSNACCTDYCSPKSAHAIPLVHLSDYVEGVLSTHNYGPFQCGENALSTASSLQPIGAANQSSFSWGTSTSYSALTSPELNPSSCKNALEMLNDKAAISDAEKIQILSICDLLCEIRNPGSAFESLDELGRRLWVAVRFQQLYFSRRHGSSASIKDMVFESKLFAWGFHSDCQENLFTSLLPSEPSWEEIRNIGIGFWYTNTPQLRLKMEKLARQQYLRSKDPKACALLYIALNRIQVLAGLFKISKDEKDKPLVGFLSRNFQDDKNKAAALKNAYVLMGRHQLELAAAFFLLGGDTSSAAAVCAKNLGDVQLALVICRLVEGYPGSSEHHLISNYLLPSAIEKTDYWLASLLEWLLGNHVQSFLIMLGIQMDSVGNKSILLCKQASFLDPSIGQYCFMLASKNALKNTVGEYNAAALARWAIWISATALDRCGLPIEALECLSTSVGILGGVDHGRMPDNGKLEVLKELLFPSRYNSYNWIMGDVAVHMERHAKIGLSMKYVSKLLSEHPSWPDTFMAPVGAKGHLEHESELNHKLLTTFECKLMACLSCLERKFNLPRLYLINMILYALSSKGLLFIGYHILRDCASLPSSQEREFPSDSSILHPMKLKLLLRTSEEVSCLFSRFVVASCMTCSQSYSCFSYCNFANENRFSCLAIWQLYMGGLKWSIWRLRTIMKFFIGPYMEESIRITFSILDLFEFCVSLGSAWLQNNFGILIMIVKPLLHTYRNGCDADGSNILHLRKLLRQIENLLADFTVADNMEDVIRFAGDLAHDQARTVIPTDLRWLVIWAASWRHASCFLKQQLNWVSGDLEDDYLFGSFDKLFFSMSGSDLPEFESNNMHKQLRLVSLVLAKLLKTIAAEISSSCMKQFATFLVLKLEDEFNEDTLMWFEGSSASHSTTFHKHLNKGDDSEEQMNMEDNSSVLEILWDLLADPKFILDGLSEQNFTWEQFIKPKPFKEWSEVYRVSVEEHEAEGRCNGESKQSSNLAGNGTGLHVRGPSPDGHSFTTVQQRGTLNTGNVMPFQKPKEVHRMNGELLEALCINSIDQTQAVLTSNRKGIIFFNWTTELALGDNSNHIWPEADWPQKGWAGSKSTPVPTCVSPGIGLGSKTGTDLGMGGATIGVNSLARPGKNLTSDGAFGVPGYAGMGASALGWQIQEDSDDIVDPPATVDNINTRAFSSHPSRPFFLVGSSNTHVYLWEFGKDKATATYGVLPAANVPPPYALASISSVQFDQSGERFATAALDGTICTWQLEVGGRSNIHPTQSSLCFNNHASDITYVNASGSIIAAAGHSSSGISVVIWDTLAPPSTSRASIMCHEGGARSLSVFDNDIGSGSISPFIVTGGKGGDVGLHDFRYIATGRTKKHRLFASGESEGNISLTTDVDTGNGDRNRDGMLWYIPKAHSGSVTKICTIPCSSLFLTGSKDGDVKLWDAKTAKLVFHWPKLHEKHTFLQPSSRGFGGVVRAAVTDIQVISHGFLTCGGDGSVKLVQLGDYVSNVFV